MKNLSAKKFCPAFVAFVFMALTFWTWRRWPSLLIDYGRELYIPWQMTLGKVLYVDVAHFNGPLAPYCNALLFKIFGVSTTVLIASSLILIALAAGGLYALLARLFEPATAAVASGAFLSVFAFGHLNSSGDFSWVCPYSYDLVYGVELALLMLMLLGAHAERPRRRWSVGAGLCLGLVFLTKAEVFLAAGLAACAWLLFQRGKKGAQAPWPRRAGVEFAAGALAAVAAGFAVLRFSMDSRDAARGVLGTWYSLMTSGAADQTTYRILRGAAEPWINGAASVKAALALALLIAAGVLGDILASREGKNRWLLIAGSAGALAAGFRLFPSDFGWRPWILIPRALPLFSLGVLAFAAARALRLRGQGKASAAPEQLACWAIFAFALLGKILLRATLRGYGFAHAMPAAVLLIVSVTRLIPDQLKRWYGGGAVFRTAALCAVMLDVLNLQNNSTYYYRSKDFEVGRGGDRLLAYGPEVSPEGGAARKVLERIEALIPPRASVMTLPTGAMLGYLSRRSSPIPYFHFGPTELVVYGEEAILASMKERPADYILIVHKEHPTAPLFGTDPSYGKRIMDWVRENYARADLIGEEPLRKRGQFGIEILKRREGLER